MRVIAQRGNAYLLEVSPLQGQVFDADLGQLFPPIATVSILARGYWEEYTGSDEAVVKLLQQHGLSTETQSLDQLLKIAEHWVVTEFPHPAHLLRTCDYVYELDNTSQETLLIAALLHDFERAYEDTSYDGPRSWDSIEYRQWHQRRSADMAQGWLLAHGADTAHAAEVAGYIRLHEDGGTPETNILQAADSLSFLETMVSVTKEWSNSGEMSTEKAQAKLYYMRDRIQFAPAEPIADRLLQAALQA